MNDDATVIAWGWMPWPNRVLTVPVWDRKGAGANLSTTKPCLDGETLVDVKLSDDGNTLFFSVPAQGGPAMYEQQLG